MLGQRDDDLVRIATAPNEWTGVMWQEMLKDVGIQSMLRSGGAGYAYMPNALNEQYLYVQARDADYAIEILEAYTGDDGQDDDPTAI